jgi:hypothetical protein
MIDDDKKKIIPQLAMIDSEFFHGVFANPSMM